MFRIHLKISMRLLAVLLPIWSLALTAKAKPNEIFVIVPFYEQPAPDETDSESDIFWQAFEKGVQQAGRDSRRKVKLMQPKSDNVNKMTVLISRAITQQPGGIIISVNNYEPLMPVLRRLKSSGIAFFTAATEENIAYEIAGLRNIGEEGYQTGQIVGARLQNNGGKFGACVITENINVEQLLMCNGFIRGFGGSSQTTRIITTQDKAVDTIKNTLARQRRIDSLFILTPGIAPEIISHLEQTETLPQYHIAAFDVSEDMLNKLFGEAGSLYALDNQPYLQGYFAVMMMASYLNTGMLPARNILTSPSFIDDTNVDKFTSFREELLKKR